VRARRPHRAGPRQTRGGPLTTESAAPDDATAAPGRSPRRERTRERLLDAAFEVFAQVGVQAASIEAVCEAAGFTRGAFYSNFASKEELFLALTEREARSHLGALERAVTTVDPAALQTPEGFRATVREVIASVLPDQAAKASWCVMELEFELLALRDPQVAQRYVDQQQQLREEMIAALNRVMVTLGLRFAIDEHVAIDLLLGAHEAGQRAAMLPATGSRRDASAMLEVLVDLIVTPA
jgi:AcrR family transcriptional regulator